MSKFSIIVTGRADKFSGNFEERLFQACKFNVALFEKNKIDYEYVLVEWDPVLGKQLLSETFIKQVPHSTAYVVGHEFHVHYCMNPWLEYREFLSKNIGIRRMNGEFGLCTNGDIILSQEIIDQIFKDPNLDKGTFYRAIYRIDISNQQYKNQFEVESPSHQVRVFQAKPPSWNEGAGEFQLASKELWEKIGGFDENIRFAKIFLDGRLDFHVLKLDIPIKAFSRVFHTFHTSSFWNNRKNMVNRKDCPYGPEWNAYASLPYKNPDDWGLSFCDDIEISPNIYKLKSRKPLKTTIPDTFEIPPEYRKK